MLDISIRLKAAGAYDHATAGGTVAGGSAFCRDNLLHVPTMERALQLRRQLLRLVNLRFGADKAWKDSATKGSLKPPGRRQTDALRQASPFTAIMRLNVWGGCLVGTRRPISISLSGLYPCIHVSMY